MCTLMFSKELWMEILSDETGNGVRDTLYVDVFLL